jgi:hypothetical protein
VLIYSIGPCTTNLLFVDVVDVSPLHSLSSRSTIADQAHTCILNLLALPPVWGCVAVHVLLIFLSSINFFPRINKINLQAQVSMAGLESYFKLHVRLCWKR